MLHFQNNALKIDLFNKTDLHVEYDMKEKKTRNLMAKSLKIDFQILNIMKRFTTQSKKKTINVIVDTKTLHYSSDPVYTDW